MLDACRAIYLSTKRPLVWPVKEEWKPTGDLKDLATTIKLELPLAGDDGVSIEALTLILEFSAVAPHDGAAILRYVPHQSYHPGRFDFGIPECHSNTPAIAGGVRGLEKRVNGSHMHPFALNAKLGLDAFRLTRNGPPAAVSIDDRRPSFRARMRAVGAEFCIEHLVDLPPPYQGDLWR